MRKSLMPRVLASFLCVVLILTGCPTPVAFAQTVSESAVSSESENVNSQDNSAIPVVDNRESENLKGSVTGNDPDKIYITDIDIPYGLFPDVYYSDISTILCTAGPNYVTAIPMVFHHSDGSEVIARLDEYQNCVSENYAEMKYLNTAGDEENIAPGDYEWVINSGFSEFKIPYSVKKKKDIPVWDYTQGCHSAPGQGLETYYSWTEAGYQSQTARSNDYDVVKVSIDEAGVYKLFSKYFYISDNSDDALLIDIVNSNGISELYLNLYSADDSRYRNQYVYLEKGDYYLFSALASESSDYEIYLEKENVTSIQKSDDEPLIIYVDSTDFVYNTNRCKVRKEYFSIDFTFILEFEDKPYECRGYLCDRNNLVKNISFTSEDFSVGEHVATYDTCLGTTIEIPYEVKDLADIDTTLYPGSRVDVNRQVITVHNYCGSPYEVDIPQAFFLDIETPGLYKLNSSNGCCYIESLNENINMGQYVYSTPVYFDAGMYLILAYASAYSDEDDILSIETPKEVAKIEMTGFPNVVPDITNTMTSIIDLDAIKVKLIYDDGSYKEDYLSYLYDDLFFKFTYPSGEEVLFEYWTIPQTFEVGKYKFQLLDRSQSVLSDSFSLEVADADSVCTEIEVNGAPLIITSDNPGRYNPYDEEEYITNVVHFKFSLTEKTEIVIRGDDCFDRIYGIDSNGKYYEINNGFRGLILEPGTYFGRVHATLCEGDTPREYSIESKAYPVAFKDCVNPKGEYFFYQCRECEVLCDASFTVEYSDGSEIKFPRMGDEFEDDRFEGLDFYELVDPEGNTNYELELHTCDVDGIYAIRVYAYRDNENPLYHDFTFTLTSPDEDCALSMENSSVFIPKSFDGKIDLSLGESYWDDADEENDREEYLPYAKIIEISVPDTEAYYVSASAPVLMDYDLRKYNMALGRVLKGHTKYWIRIVNDEDVTISLHSLSDCGTIEGEAVTGSLDTGEMKFYRIFTDYDWETSTYSYFRLTEGYMVELLSGSFDVYDFKTSESRKIFYYDDELDGVYAIVKRCDENAPDTFTLSIDSFDADKVVSAEFVGGVTIPAGISQSEIDSYLNDNYQVRLTFSDGSKKDFSLFDFDYYRIFEIFGFENQRLNTLCGFGQIKGYYGLLRRDNDCTRIFIDYTASPEDYEYIMKAGETIILPKNLEYEEDYSATSFAPTRRALLHIETPGFYLISETNRNLRNEVIYGKISESGYERVNLGTWAYDVEPGIVATHGICYLEAGYYQLEYDGDYDCAVSVVKPEKEIVKIEAIDYQPKQYLSTDIRPIMHPYSKLRFTYDDNSVVEGTNDVNEYLLRSKVYKEDGTLAEYDEDNHLPVGKYYELYSVFNASVKLPFEVVKSVGEKISLIHVDVKLSLPENFAYEGKPITPAETITYEGETLKRGIDYKISYSNNNAPGRMTITIDGIGRFKDQRVISFDVPLAKPSITKTSIEPEGIMLTYSKVPGATSYTIYVKEDAGSYKEAGKTSELSYTYKAAAYSKKYTFKVVATCGSIVSAESAESETVTYVVGPDVTSISNKSTGIEITWEDINGATGYEIYRKTGSGKYEKITTIKKGTTKSYLDKNVESGKLYIYKIKTVSGKNVSDFGAIGTLTFLSATKLTSIASKCEKVTLSWNKVSGADGYKIYRKEGSGAYSLYATVKKAATVSYTDKSAKAKTKYSYKIAAYKGASLSVESAAKSIKAVGHSMKEKITPATTVKSGKITNTCEYCSKKVTTTINPAKKVSIEKTEYDYTGKAIKPKMSVCDSKGNKISTKFYTIKYENNKAVGRAKVTVSFKGNYSGAAVKTFDIFPKGTTIKSIKGKSKSLVVNLKAQKKETTGYMIQYSTKEDFKGAKTVKVKNSVTSQTIKSLKANTKYYVRVCTYKTVKVDGKDKDFCSDWSEVSASLTLK